MTTDVAEYRSILIEIAGRTSFGDSVKVVLARIARKTGLSDRRVRSIWHGEVKDIRARELAALLRAARDAKALEEGFHERDQFLARLAAVEAAVGLSSSANPRALDHAEGMARRSTDRPLASGE